MIELQDQVHKAVEALPEIDKSTNRRVDAHDYEPFPTSLLPSEIGRLVENRARSIQCDPAFVAVPILTVLGAAIGTTHAVRMTRTWRVYPNVWAMIVGDSGSAKSPALKVAIRPVEEIERDLVEQYRDEMADHDVELKKYERDFAIWRKQDGEDDPPVEPDEPSCQRLIVDDVTIEKLASMLEQQSRGLLACRDELSSFFGDFGRYNKGADDAKYLSMFDGSPIRLDRKGSVSNYVHTALLSIVGGVQPGVLRRQLTTHHQESGMAARFLYCYPPKIRRRWNQDEIEQTSDERVFEEAVARLHACDPLTDESGILQPIEHRLSREAECVWENYYNDHMDEQFKLDGALSAAWSKLSAYAVKFGLIHHMTTAAIDSHPIHDESGDIGAESMEFGVSLARWFGAESRRVYQMLGEEQQAGLLDKVVELVRRKGGAINLSELSRSARQVKDTTHAHSLLTELVASGQGDWIDDEQKEFALSTRLSVYSSIGPDRREAG